MFLINEDDMSIYLTRGDTALFQVSAMKSETERYVFQPGDVVRIKVFEKKACENVVLQKEFGIEEETEVVTIFLDERETKIGEVISKPKDYWYEIELNPFTEPQTIIGYDDDGAKVLKLFPEGADVPDVPIEEEDIPFVDAELSLISTRPVQNQAVTRAIVTLRGDLKTTTELLEKTRSEHSEDIESLEGELEETQRKHREDCDSIDIEIGNVNEKIIVERTRIDELLIDGTHSGDEVIDARIGANGVVHRSLGTAIREQLNDKVPLNPLKTLRKYDELNLVVGEDVQPGEIIEFKYDVSVGYSYVCNGNIYKYGNVTPVTATGLLDASLEVPSDMEYGTVKLTNVFIYNRVLAISEISWDDYIFVCNSDGTKLVSAMEFKSVAGGLEVTDEIIKYALGYTPGNEEDVNTNRKLIDKAYIERDILVNGVLHGLNDDGIAKTKTVTGVDYVASFYIPEGFVFGIVTTQTVYDDEGNPSNSTHVDRFSSTDSPLAFEFDNDKTYDIEISKTVDGKDIPTEEWAEEVIDRNWWKYDVEMLSNQVVPPEMIESAVDRYFEKNPIETGATEEQAEQIENNRESIINLKNDVNNLTPLHNMNGCIVCNGEEITLTVGEDIEVGQVLTFDFICAEGYSYEAKGKTGIVDSFKSTVSLVPGVQYGTASVTIDATWTSLYIKGAYFVAVRPITNTVQNKLDELSATINDLRTEIGLELEEVASLLGGDA